MTLNQMTISEIQRAQQTGELSAREIARRTLDDIARVNPHINAWTTVTEARMLAEADSIDTLRRGNQPLPPLAGVPYAVKNLFDVYGQTTLAGANRLVLRSNRSPRILTAPSVERPIFSGRALSRRRQKPSARSATNQSLGIAGLWRS